MGSLHLLFPLIGSDHELPSRSYLKSTSHQQSVYTRGSQIEHELQSPGGLVTPQLPGLPPLQSFWFSRSGVGYRNRHFWHVPRWCLHCCNRNYTLWDPCSISSLFLFNYYCIRSLFLFFLRKSSALDKCIQWLNPFLQFNQVLSCQYFQITHPTWYRTVDLVYTQQYIMYIVL